MASSSRLQSSFREAHFPFDLKTVVQLHDYLNAHPQPYPRRARGANGGGAQGDRSGSLDPRIGAPRSTQMALLKLDPKSAPKPPPDSLVLQHRVRIANVAHGLVRQLITMDEPLRSGRPPLRPFTDLETGC